jgi:geranylgeranyl pyrophosphate synthase
MSTPYSHSTHAEVAPYLAAVGDALKATLDSYAGTLPPTLVQIGKEALSVPGKVMAETLAQATGECDSASLPLPRWPLYVILSYRSAVLDEERDAWQEAVPAAVALEIAIAATDILDELADADPSPIVRQHGPGQAMNTANLLLVVAQQTLLKRGMEPGGERALQALNALLDIGLEAGVGQHLDMLYGGLGPQDVTLDMSAHVTSLKAGALIAGACRMGALMAGADGEVLELLTRFGREMGGMAQVLNDIQDVLPQDTAGEIEGLPGRKTDLRLRKRTLPVVFTLRDEGPEPNALQRAFSGTGEAKPDEEAMSQAILDAGGVQFAQLVIEVHRQNVFQTLEKLEALRPGARKMLSTLFSVEDDE